MSSKNRIHRLWMLDPMNLEQARIVNHWRQGLDYPYDQIATHFLFFYYPNHNLTHLLGSHFLGRDLCRESVDVILNAMSNKVNS